ncbi:MAG: dTDP-4-dehydrorhamnose reductase [Pelolinea sp.]|nr:dTDP-4-dehydrorhamnose reductase [Pelolinea sp.]
MKILLLGNTGQLGWELNRTLLTVGDVIALDYPQINMADPGSLKTIIREYKPNLIINATAYTDVDKAESEPEKAMAINGTGPGVLAEEALKSGAALIHYSTDYVFDGSKGEAYTEEDEPNPINMYGLSKLRGEQAVQQVGGAYLILRTAWVYSLRRPCFVTKVLEWAKTQKVLRIVDDQVSSPTWARMLAEATALVIAQGRREPVDYIKKKTGLYHLAGAGAASRYEWAKEILRYNPKMEEPMTLEIQRASTSEFPTPVRRPLFSALNCDHFTANFGISTPPWEMSLRMAMERSG